MDFTYKAYKELLELIKKNGYEITKFIDEKTQSGTLKRVIIRHDVDWSVEKAFEFASFENEQGVEATYFFLVRTDAYNVLSGKNTDLVKKIHGMGHDIALHFDEVVYRDGDISEYIKKETRLLGDLVGIPIKSVSMHRPSKETLESNLKIDGLINTYSSVYFNEYKYLSDSRCRWREDAVEIIRSQSYKKIQLLTHPIWYTEANESMANTLAGFIRNAQHERYLCIKDNITDAESIFKDGYDFIG